LKPFAAFIFAGVVAGCAPHYVILTPDTLPRAATHDYPFELAWQTRRSGANNPDVRTKW
jgi:hypothetical protein